MQTLDHCLYPPRIAADVEISEQRDAGRVSFVAGSASVGRYLRLGEAERRVIGLLDGNHTIEAISNAGPGLEIADLVRFLSTLDKVGILDGPRDGREQQPILPGNQFYLRRSLFNPDPLFGRVLPPLRWIWTRSFFLQSLLLLSGTSALALLNWAQLSKYGTAALREDYIAVFIAAWLITLSHEFAHGITSKAFGGRATEIGVLFIYYCLPALYCNVSGLHLIPKRGQRMWVIAAGMYWQLLVGAGALMIWFVFDPNTLGARIAMILTLGSLIDVFFNANPLIKLDGYYFLSQWVRIPNLMDRSREAWRSLIRRFIAGDGSAATSRLTNRERRILLTFGFLSFFYNLALPLLLVCYATQYLMDWFEFMGLLMSAALLLAYVWKPVKNMFKKNEGFMGTNTFSKAVLEAIPPCLRSTLFGTGAMFSLDGLGRLLWRLGGNTRPKHDHPRLRERIADPNQRSTRATDRS
jgi:putative peptide zinc metalloprotease protein